MQRAMKPATAGMIVWAALSAHGWGCSIPVFRYALEHWQPDDFVLQVSLGEPLSQDKLNRLQQLTDPDPDGRPGFNLRIETVAAELLAPADALRNSSPPGAVAIGAATLSRPARNERPAEVIWSGTLTEQSLKLISTSPLRQAIGKQLLEGESVVWVLLEAGDAEANAHAWTTLTAELARLQEQLKLPPIDPADAAELTVTPESLKLSFTAHRLSRENADERVLIESLLSVEPDLREAALERTPMAFPIFGRGRVLYALVGAGINTGTIEEACRFLTAGCQCTVKQQNPGADLLLPVAWSRYVEPTTVLKSPLPPLSGVQAFGAQDTPAAPAADLDEPTTPVAHGIAAGSPAASSVAPSPAPASGVPTADSRRTWLDGTALAVVVVVGSVIAGAWAMGAARR